MIGYQYGGKMKYKMVTFSYGGIHPRMHDSVIGETHRAIYDKNDLSYQNFSASALICKSRSFALSEFWFNGEEDGVIFIDHDVQWNPGDAIGTLEHAISNNAVLAGLYAKKYMGGGFASGSSAQGGSKVVVGKGHNMCPADRLAAGFLAIPRTCVAKMLDELYEDSEKFNTRFDASIASGDKKRIINDCMISIGMFRDNSLRRGISNEKKDGEYIDFFRTMRYRNSEGRPQYTSEDFSFTARCVEAGITVAIDGHAPILHWGEHGFSLEDANRKAK